MEGVDARANTRIAHGRVSPSWGVEATAPASEFRDQYCARARHGLLRLEHRFRLMLTLKTTMDFEMKSIRFRLEYDFVAQRITKPEPCGTN